VLKFVNDKRGGTLDPLHVRTWYEKHQILHGNLTIVKNFAGQHATSPKIFVTPVLM